MKPSIQTKLQNLAARYEEVKVLLSDPNVTNDLNRFRDLSKEYAQLEPNVQMYYRYQMEEKNLTEAKELSLEEDPELQQLAKQEIKHLEESMSKLEEEILFALLPKDPHDNNNIFLEIRGGTGGDEAAIFAGDLARMYMRYAEKEGWKVETISESHGEHGGYKEVIMRIIGQGA